ncbi:hypothetical protein J6590_085216 [Homalodisca vitripennis]|nr:hypothetical protein J6590_085216 [Homalodisca vitripennis]
MSTTFLLLNHRYQNCMGPVAHPKIVSERVSITDESGLWKPSRAETGLGPPPGNFCNIRSENCYFIVTLTYK